MKHNFIITNQLSRITVCAIILVSFLSNHVYTNCYDFWSILTNSSIFVCIIIILWRIICDCSYGQIVCGLLSNAIDCHFDCLISILFHHSSNRHFRNIICLISGFIAFSISFAILLRLYILVAFLSFRLPALVLCLHIVPIVIRLF